MRSVVMLALLCLLGTPNVTLAGKKDEAPAAGWRVAEDPIYQLPEQLDNKESIVEWVATPDGRHIAYQVSKLHGFLGSGLAGKSVYYYAIDGVETPEFEALKKRGLQFGPGGRISYAARREGKWFVFLDGVPGPALDEAGRPLFSADGRRFGYIGRVDGLRRVYLDHEAQAGTDSTIDFALSRDGSHLACGIQWGDTAWVTLDGVPGPRFRHLVEETLAFAPDGGRFGYVAGDDRGRIPVLDQQEWEPAEEADGPIFSPDGSRVAFAVMRAGKWAIAEPDGTGPWCDTIASGDLFDSSGSHLAYAAAQDGRWVVFVDGVRGPEFDNAHAPVFSSDGKRVGYLARRGGRWLAVVDGTEGPEYESVASGGPAFSPDGTHVSYLAGSGKKWQLVMDGVAGPPHQSLLGHPTFSPDGRHYAYCARDKNRWFPVIDGAPVDARYDAIVAGAPTWLDDSTLEFLGFRDRKLIRVRLSRGGD